MWNPFRTRRERLEREAAQAYADRAAERATLLEALELVAEQFAKTTASTHEMVSQLAAAQSSQAKAFSDHLSLFKVENAPTSRVIRDIDEVRAEIARNPTSHIPDNLTQKQQLEWVLANSQ